jgi:uncharacterized RDD family membrane protein YckC
MAYVSINTVQNVRLDYEVAGVGLRLLACFIDFCIKIAYVVIFGFLIGLLSDFWIKHVEDMQLIIIMLTIGLPALLYSLLFEIFFNGQTPGKKMLNIQVVRLDGLSPTVGNYLMRWIFRIVDVYIFYGLPAIIAIAASQRAQRLGDMAAGTTVICTRQRVRLDDISSFHDDNYYPQYPEAVKLSEHDISLIRQILKNAERHSLNPDVLQKAKFKVLDIIGITETQQPALEFLETIVNDYDHYARVES